MDFYVVKSLCDHALSFSEVCPNDSTVLIFLLIAIRVNALIPPISKFDIDLVGF